MHAYVYPFRLESRDNEVFFVFPHFPEIISSLYRRAAEGMSAEQTQDYATGAVVAALQTRIATRGEIPAAPHTMHVQAHGFVTLTVGQAMKLELFRLYKENTRTIADFAQHIKKDDTAARRLLDLKHNSIPAQIESAISAFGSILIHRWDIEAQHPSRQFPHSARALHL